MAYIGNTVQNQGFAPAIDYFNGNGVTVTFTLSRPVASVAQVIVAVDNVIQNPSSAFGVVGNSITFTSAPLSGTNNIWVEYTSLITTYQGISQDPTVIGDIRATGGYLAEGDFGNSFVDGNLIDYVTGRGRFTVGELDDITFYHGGTSARSEMMDLYYAGGAKIYGTTALTIPVGTTGERPGTPAVGMIRYNTTTGYAEYYGSSGWQSIAGPYNIDYLVVAGGASGGNGFSNTTGTTGGGGAGGLLIGTSVSITPGQTFAATVGAGGAGIVQTSGNSVSGNNGSNSSLVGTGISATAIGGGAGGSGNPSAAGSGGSGGGGGSALSGASGTSGQGFAGGNGGGTSGGGGGGGAGSVGGNANSGVSSGNGGTGYQWVNSTFYASGGGGGGAAGPTTTPGSASAGGGTAGGVARSLGGSTVSNAATANTGGGSGGSGSSDSSGTCTTGAGGSGVVIIRYVGSQKGSGGTVTSSGGYTYHTFTSSGTYTA
jgi:hypothetical protein